MSDIIKAYQQVVGNEVIDQLYQLALLLKGLQILHVNSTAMGGGVAEILNKMVPLMNALGIETRWEVIKETKNSISAQRASTMPFRVARFTFRLKP